MSHLLLAFLIGLVLYFHFRPAAPIEHAATASSSPAVDAADASPKPKDSEEARAEYFTAPQIVKEIAQEENVSLKEAMNRVARRVANARTLHLCGGIVQHLSDGHLLVRHSSMKPEYNLPLGDYALWGFDEPCADDEPIECAVVPTALYTYHSVDGGTRTVYEVFYCPRANEGAAAAAASAAPGAWMWQDKTSLDRGAYKDRSSYIH